MGIERAGNPDHKFQYNGKEKQSELGLNWYDYHARQYDPQIGRFTTIDPDADNYYDLTPYNYVDNSPINNIDPDGKNIWTKVAKAAVKVGKTVAKDGVSSLKNGATYADAVSDIVADVSTLTDSKASLADRVFAGASLASELLPVSVGDVKDAYKLAKAVGDKAGDVKKVPNPYGKNGGPAHQKTVGEAEKDMQDRGLETQREVKVNTPNGSKKSRYVDVVGTDSKTGNKEYVNVGKQNKNGTPVARERRAQSDIESATGKKMRYEPYNK